jgi:predicted RNase H-like nuclease
MLTIKNNRYSCVGIDGCKGKWVVVYITENAFEVEKFKTINDICSRYPDSDSYIIDIPIGLAENKSQLRPDLIVKKELGKKGSSIFEVPCRQAVYAEDKKVARERNIAILGKSLSEQTLGIAKAIKQVDEFLQSKPQWKNRLLESHPEFCFSKLNNNQPILEHKTSAEGQQKRLGILRKYYPKADQVVEKFLADVPYRKKIDDVVDALCLAVMGRLILEKGLKTIPKKPMMDDKGILMQMVYAE